MKNLLRRVKNILVRPGLEWQAIKHEPTTYADIILRYVSMLAIIPPAAAIAGRLILDRNIADSAVGQSISYLVVTNVLWYCMYILNVAIAGLIITAIVPASESRGGGLQGLKIAAYSFTPLFIAGCIAVVPKMGWIVNVAIAYSVYLLYQGIVGLASVPRKQAVWYTAGSFLSASVIVVVMNLFEYFFESIVISKIIF